MATHPAPSGCVYWLSPLVTVNGSGYRIRKRCNSSSERAQKDRYINYTTTDEQNGDGYRNYYDCNGTPAYSHWITDGTALWVGSNAGPGIFNIEVYCDGSTREYYDAIGVNTAPGLAAYCWLSKTDTSIRCLPYDTIYADYVPVEQCYNRLTGLYEPCARNCADPAKKGSPVEVCGNGIDDNCNGERDEGCAVCVDGDGDGNSAYDPITCPGGNDCDDNNAAKNRRNEDGDGYSTCDGDCDEDPVTGPGTYPGAKDICDGKDNNCNADTDEDCCEVDTVSVNPPWVRPKGTGGYTQAEVSVTLFRPAPPGGCTVDLIVEPVENSGGHKHDGARPKGNIIPPSIGFSYGETEKDPDEPKPKYVSSKFSGEEKIKATIQDGRGGEAEITVKVPALQPMPASPYYRLTGKTPLHPDNHYGKDTTLSFMFLIGYDFYNQFKATLGINDMNLKSGGGFDIYGNWLEDITYPECRKNGHGHCSHRKGTSVDIDRSALGENGWEGVDRTEVEKICKRYGGSLANESTYHCEFRGG